MFQPWTLKASQPVDYQLAEYKQDVYPDPTLKLRLKGSCCNALSSSSSLGLKPPKHDNRAANEPDAPILAQH